MSEQEAVLSGPDFARGVPLSDVPDGGMLAGHFLGKPVLLSRVGEECSAIGGVCTHYGAPLGEGIVVDGTVRCPWHHACFRLRTGEAIRAPALNPLARFIVKQRDDRVYVSGELDALDGATPLPDADRPAIVSPGSVVIVGAGAAGNAAAEMLRRLGYGGPLTLIGADDATPYDRPNLSKDYLAGNAPEEWIPLRPAAFYAQHDITLLTGTRVTAIDTARMRVRLDNGREMPYERLLLATGAEPVRLPLPGGDLPHVHYLRTLADSRAIIARATNARRAVVMGASFIGLEVAASLRARELEVHVVAPEALPLQRVMGDEMGAFIRALHERHGVAFHLQDVATRIDGDSVTLRSGARLSADLVVIGVGVRPSLGLAESAGLSVDRGIVVDEFLETSAPGVFAAGDIARWPDRPSGERVRVEHWVVAERMGQTVARNMLGLSERFEAVPFFWSAHYDTTVRYVGHAEQWDRVEIDGDLNAGDAAVRFLRGDRILAVATLGRDVASLRAEAAMETTN